MVKPTEKEHGRQDRDQSSDRRNEDKNDRSERKQSSYKHRRSSHDRDRDREDGRHRRYHEHRPRHHRPTEERQRTATLPKGQEDPEESEYFMIDRRGDAKNVEYGGLHRYTIPAYQRIGYGRVLGADEYAKIDREASTDKCIVLRVDRGRGIERPERLLAKKVAKTNGRIQRLILPQVDADMKDADTSMDFDLDFVALRPSRKRKRGSESPEDSLLDTDYRSVEGKAKPHPRPQDEDLEFESNSDETEEASTLDDHTRMRNAELSRATKTDSASADTWLALVDFQAYHTFPGLVSSGFTTSQRRTVSDIRLAILDQASKAIPTGAMGHDRLLLAQIEEGSKVWETSKLSKAWQDALMQNPQSMLLWREYLGYLQSDPATFRYEYCKDAYLKCLATLTNGLVKAEIGTRPNMVNEIIYVVTRYTNFTRDAGYDELAIATWQALLEFHLFPPDLPKDQAKLDAFEDFWESDTPRIGEKGSVGWRAHISEQSSMPRCVMPYVLPSLDTDKPLASFAIAERRIASAFLLPGGTGDEDESDDPFRYVMYSDIRPVLQRLPETLDSRLLVDAFLCFMGLPPIDQRNGFPQEWRPDSYWQSANMADSTFQAPSRRYISFSLFQNAFRDHESNEAIEFAAQALFALVQAFPEYEELGEYLLACLSQTKPADATKAAKRLLKGRPTSLRYYNAYALKEATAGSSDLPAKAEQIWRKALELSSSLTEDARDETVLLWHSWLMTCVHHGDDKIALHILLIMPDESAAAIQNAPANISAGAVLRAKRHLEGRIDHMHLKGNLGQTALYADCLAWLNYLSAGHDYNAALQSFSSSSARFRKANSMYVLELIHQAKAHLLGCHMVAKRPFRPTLFRDELAESRRLFPENGVVLKQYYEVANLTRLDDRLRSALSETSGVATPVSQGLVSWTFAIDAEIARCSVDGASATRDSVRALFRRALLAPDSKISASPALWKRWLDFETSALQRLADGDAGQRRDAVRRAKQVLFDGLRFLPWHKRWAIGGMAIFAESGEMSEEDLRQIHDMMVDRELRLRVDVDKV